MKEPENSITTLISFKLLSNLHLAPRDQCCHVCKVRIPYWCVILKLCPTLLNWGITSTCLGTDTRLCENWNRISRKSLTLEFWISQGESYFSKIAQQWHFSYGFISKPSLTRVHYSRRVQATEATVLTKYNQIQPATDRVSPWPRYQPQQSSILQTPTTIRVSGIFCVTLIVTMILALCSQTFYYKYFWTFCLFLSKFTACRVVCFTELCDILNMKCKWDTIPTFEWLCLAWWQHPLSDWGH